LNVRQIVEWASSVRSTVCSKHRWWHTCQGGWPRLAN
jgi:hypothetical protein